MADRRKPDPVENVAFPNLSTQFRPGQTGNPLGRPRGESLTAELRRLLEAEARIKDRPAGHGVTNRSVLAEKLFAFAAGGDSRMMRLLLERADGRPAANVEERPEPTEDAEGPRRRIVIPDTDDRHPA